MKVILCCRFCKLHTKWRTSSRKWRANRPCQLWRTTSSVWQAITPGSCSVCTPPPVICSRSVTMNTMLTLQPCCLHPYASYQYHVNCVTKQSRSMSTPNSKLLCRRLSCYKTCAENITNNLSSGFYNFRKTVCDSRMLENLHRGHCFHFCFPTVSK